MITSDTPVLVSTASSTLFDTWWLTQLSVNANNPNEPIQVGVAFRLVRFDVPTSTYVAYLDAGGSPVEKTLQIPNLGVTAVQNPNVDIAGLMDTVVNAAGMLGKTQGVIN